MTNWRDPETNLNMFPFVIRCAQDAIVENGGQLRWGYQGLALDQTDDGVVTGAVFRDIDGTLHRVNAKAVVVATGGYGGNPDMRLDLSDSLRNIAWAHGADRNDVSSTGMCMGRDGSGIRMVMWAGGVFQANRTAGGCNGVPGFPFGGMWTAFGNDGRRFMNEHLFNATNGHLATLPNDWIIANVTDANWEAYLTHQGYGHENMNMDDTTVLAEVRDQMTNYVTGPDGFDVRFPAHYGFEYAKVYAAETLEELATSSATTRGARPASSPRWPNGTRCAPRARTRTGASTRAACSPSTRLPTTRPSPRPPVAPRAAWSRATACAPTTSTARSTAGASPSPASTWPAAPAASATAITTPRSRPATPATAP